MPRRKLDKKKNEYIMVAIEPDKKAAFDAYCEENNTTMSEMIRAQIAEYVSKGKQIMIAKSIG